jgi:proline iminopeptidase
MRTVAIALVLCALGCSERRDVAPRPAASPEPEEPERCGSDEAWSGGQVRQMPDHARVYYRVAGPADAPAVLFVHGGPGGNSVMFERSAGPELEHSLRMVYVDQRGCGRSSDGPQDVPLGMEPTIADFERIREHLSIAHWSVIGHSFGGLVTLAYVKAHPDAIDRVVLVDTTADWPAAFEHEITILAASATNPDVVRIAQEARPAVDRMLDLYQAIGRVQVQQRLAWHDPAAQRRAEAWDQNAELGECARDGVLPAYRNAGWADAHPELMVPLGRPTLVIAGRYSEIVGAELLSRSAQGWRAPVRWMQQSGHFPFVEEPTRFAEETSAFIRGTSDRRARQ